MLKQDVPYQLRLAWLSKDGDLCLSKTDRMSAAPIEGRKTALMAAVIKLYMETDPGKELVKGGVSCLYELQAIMAEKGTFSFSVL